MVNFLDNAALPASVTKGAASAASSQPGATPAPPASKPVDVRVLTTVPTVLPGTLISPPMLPGVDPRSLLSRVAEAGAPILSTSGSVTMATAGGAAVAALDIAGQAASEAKAILDKESGNWTSSSFSFSPISGGILDKRSYVNKTIGMVKDIITVVELIYDVVNALQADYDNLYKVLQALLEVLLKQLQDALVTLASTGVYMLPITPDMSSMETLFSPGGGAQGALDKMDRKLFDTKDPNRPIFNGKSDYVGGFAVVLTTGSNVGDLIDNLNKLGNFIKGMISTGAVDAPAGVRATPGMFTKDIKWNPDDLTEAADNALALVRKYPGVKLEWEHPKDLHNAKQYAVIRCRFEKGNPLYDGKGNPLLGRDGKPLYDFNDTSFGGKEKVSLSMPVGPGLDAKVLSKNAVLVDVPFGGKLSYTDFAVNDGATYYYRVAPVFKTSNGFTVVGTALSQEAHAKVVSCVPDNDASKFVTETAAGFFDEVNEGDPPDWRNETLRTILGPDLDQLFKKLAGFVEQLSGMAQTASDHFQEQLDNIKNFLKRAEEFMAQLETVLQALENLKFSGGAMILPLAPKPTGLKVFAERIKKAKMSEKLKKYLAENSDLCSVTFAMLVVIGYPSMGSMTDALELSDADVKRMKDAGTFADTKASFDKAKKDLDKKTDDALGLVGLTKKEVADKAFNLFLGLLGGGK